MSCFPSATCFPPVSLRPGSLTNRTSFLPAGARATTQPLPRFGGNKSPRHVEGSACQIGMPAQVAAAVTQALFGFVNKAALNAQIIARLDAELLRYAQAAREAQAGASDEQSCVENKYDIR